MQPPIHLPRNATLIPSEGQHYTQTLRYRHAKLQTTRLLALFLLFAGQAGSSTVAAGFSDAMRPFLKSHCYDCHGNSEPEGDLDLTRFDGGMDSSDLVDRWTRIYDRIARGEMPPKEMPRPAVSEVEAMLAWISPRLTQADRAQREVVHRRLNREEYQNTVHDLLLIDIELKPFLPEDQIAGGFDNNGEALAISTEQMEAYLEAAQFAIEAAIVRGNPPITETVTADSIKEVKPYFGKSYELVDDRIVTFMVSKSTYSKIATRTQPVPTRGRYRFSFEAATRNSSRPLTFLVDAAGQVRYYEAAAEPTAFEFEAVMPAKGIVQFHAIGLPEWVNDPVQNKSPGIGFGPVTISGPLYDAWPPASHQRLVGSVDLDNATQADAEMLLRAFMRRAFRRPASDAEVNRYLALINERLAAGRSFDQALQVGYASVLCSPNFLYLAETNGSPSERISDLELASRLSYFLWSSLPDDELLQLAAAGRLSDREVLASQVNRMLRDSRIERFIDNFTGQWLRLREIDETTPDSKLFPEFDDYLKHSMIWETQAFFRKLLSEDRSIDLFLDSDFAILNRRLAEHYGLPEVQGAELRPVSLPAESVRGGVLTQAAVLKVTANGTNTSPVVRGVWALENILGKHVPPPPASVSVIEPDIRGTTTVREQLEKHRDSESCRVCHQYIDPPGFALESFDPVGRFRTNYIRFQVNPQFADKGWGRLVEGAAVDPSGMWSTGETFDDIRGFKKMLLAHRDDFARCLTEKLFTYGLGREMGFSDRAEIERVAELTRNPKHGLRSLVREIVLSPTFSQR
ncbi:MAG: DUF1592 domain-containing protein [Planctomycetales bacterium]|nr:DUF1592 domain-containing protein [Planctomycetales bacterium]